MIVAWHPTSWCSWYMSEDEKKEIEPFQSLWHFSTNINTFTNYQLLNDAATKQIKQKTDIS